MADCCHLCQPVLDALEELRISRLVHAMRPYLPSSPLPPPRNARRAAAPKVLRQNPLPARTPAQRTKTAAAQEERLTLLPHYRPTRDDINSNRGGRA